jgi:hypothetical protein
LQFGIAVVIRRALNLACIHVVAHDVNAPVRAGDVGLKLGAAVHDVVSAADDLGVKVLTLYTFSTENWTRPREETDALMSLIEEATRSELPEFQRNNVKVHVSGDLEGLPKSLRNSLREDMEATAGNTGITLNLAINYGGRQEILTAARRAAADVSLAGRVTTADGRGIRNAHVVISGNGLPESRTVTTGSFGYYSFDGLTAGQTYVVTVNSQRYTFSVPSRVITLVDNLADVNFTADQ